MKYKGLIAALGNPGEKYANTRHNFGWMAADHILALAKARKSMRCELLENLPDYQLYRINIAGSPYLLTKPQTYMNLSGRAVGKICGNHSISPSELLVMHDDLDLELGRIKLKRGGGMGGHHGLESIEGHLNTRDFFRLRFGIGRPETGMAIHDWVLEPFRKEELEMVSDALKKAWKGLDLFYRRGSGFAMQYLHSLQHKDD